MESLESKQENIINEDKRNYIYLSLLASTIFLGVFLNFMNIGLMEFTSFRNTTITTIMVYTVLLAVSMYYVYKYHGFTLRKFAVYVLILLIFISNYAFIERSRSYFIGKEMILVYIFFLPMSIYVVGSITNWYQFRKVFVKFARYAVIIGTLSLTLIGISDYIDYMQFSYSLLVFIVVLYFDFRENKTTINLIFFIVGLINIFVFGARGPILFIVAFIFLYEIFTFKKSNITLRVIELFALLLIAIVFIFFNSQFNNLLMQIAELTGSRFLTTLLGNSLFESTGREVIYSQAFSALGKMNFRIYGLFGDRYFVKSVYVHNIFLEFLLSFGFIIGIIVHYALFYIMAKTNLLQKDINLKLIAVLFTCSLFFRFLISGSFVIEGGFYLYIAIIINHIRIKPYTSEEGN